MATKDFITYTKNGNVINVIAARNIGAARSTNLSINGKGITLNLPISQKEGTGDFYLESVIINQPRYSTPITYKFEYPRWFLYGDTLEVVFDYKEFYYNQELNVEFVFTTPLDLLVNPIRDIKSAGSSNMNSISNSYNSNNNSIKLKALVGNKGTYYSAVNLVLREDTTKRLTFKISGERTK